MSSIDVCASVIIRVVYSECLFVCVHGGTFMVWLTGVYVPLCHIKFVRKPMVVIG